MAKEVKSEKANSELLSAILDQMYSKLTAMHFMLNSSIKSLSEMVENYSNPGGTALYSEVLKMQTSLNDQLSQLQKDIDGVHQQHMQLLRSNASSGKLDKPKGE